MRSLLPNTSTASPMPYTGSKLIVRFTAKGERRFINSTEVENAYTVHTPASKTSQSQS